MASPTEDFFDQLGRRGHEPLLAKVSGTVRFEMVRGVCTEPWYVTVDNGDVKVTRESAEAEAVVRVDHELFDRIASGEVSLIPRLLRGEVAIEGDGALAVALERLLPAPNPPVRLERPRS